MRCAPRIITCRAPSRPRTGWAWGPAMGRRAISTESGRMTDVTVIGAGVAGLCAALACARAGLLPRLIDRHGAPGPHGCCWWAGGMLAPYCEGAVAEPAIVGHGQRAAAFWEKVTPVSHHGSLVVALARDRGELDRFARRTTARRRVTDLSSPEPDLSAQRAALFLEHEAHLDPRAALADLVKALRAQDIEIEQAEVTPTDIAGPVIDARGLSADLPGVRGAGTAQRRLCTGPTLCRGRTPGNRRRPAPGLCRKRAARDHPGPRVAPERAVSSRLSDGARAGRAGGRLSDPGHQGGSGA
ncbi:FAD-dependent oxidoreductase [Rhodovulum sp.]|uniref:FAD-dependent oxidoreductase n=1 Tax=Rhodovulum sp. TaxID=34009 RepID=UPI0032E47F6C